MKSILIIDDSTYMRGYIKKVITKYGYKVVGEASGGADGIEMYKALRPDIVTLDITMDGMNGVETLKEIMSFDENASVIMVSAMGQSSLVAESIIAGAKNFLVKPFKEENMIKAFEKIGK